MVEVPGCSLELCGGTHVGATGEIGLFIITSESGVAAGTRRIEAITGLDSLRAHRDAREELGRLASALNARPGDLTAKLSALQEQVKRLQREQRQATLQALTDAGPGDQRAGVAGVSLVAQEVLGLDKDAMRSLVDTHRSRIGSGVVVLAQAADGKVSIVVGVTSDLVKQAPAGRIVKQLAPLVGGGGGGRPDFAEAGGRDASRIGEMLAAAPKIIETLLDKP